MFSENKDKAGLIVAKISLNDHQRYIKDGPDFS